MARLLVILVPNWDNLCMHACNGMQLKARKDNSRRVARSGIGIGWSCRFSQGKNCGCYSFRHSFIHYVTTVPEQVQSCLFFIYAILLLLIVLLFLLLLLFLLSLWKLKQFPMSLSLFFINNNNSSSISCCSSCNSKQKQEHQQQKQPETCNNCIVIMVTVATLVVHSKAIILAKIDLQLCATEEIACWSPGLGLSSNTKTYQTIDTIKQPNKPTRWAEETAALVGCLLGYFCCIFIISIATSAHWGRISVKFKKNYS